MVYRRKYAFRPGRSLPVPAQDVGEELERLGIYTQAVTPSEIVDAARDEDAILHPCFEWDDRVAAEQMREEQARALTRTVLVMSEDAEDGQANDHRIAFVSIGTPGRNGSPGYIATETALSDEGMREVVLKNALAQLRGWRSRYSHLEELADVIQVIDDTLVASA